jgi:hypothetical protein
VNACIGWDIGGVNLKGVALASDGRVRKMLERPFEIWREPGALTQRLAELDAVLEGAPLHAVTMTAELADCFPTKREGVAAVLDAVLHALPASRVIVFGTRGFLSPEQAQGEHMQVAGSNWCAAAAWLASEMRGGGILVDVGSTTTDVVPFGGGRVLARGWTDPERLLEGELVYTGALRTPLCSLLRTAPLSGRECPVAAEHFAIVADAHLWLGRLAPADYACPTPDGGEVTREGAASRLARMVCADREMLSDEEVTAIAERVADLQVEIIATALERAAARLLQDPAGPRSSRPGSVDAPPRPERTGTEEGLAEAARAFTAGSGSWLGEEAARRTGLPVEPLSARIGDAARVLPAYAVARLANRARPDPNAGRAIGSSRRESRAQRQDGPRISGVTPIESARLPACVVKVGGSLAREPATLQRVLRALCGGYPPPLVVPGGGLLADAVRRVQSEGGISEATAHRMALLALDQCALWMAELAAGAGPARAVRSPEEVEHAMAGRELPVLAPADWLGREDALPASWEVTSDSIAAWVAGRIGARRLLLLKSFGFSAPEIDVETLGDAGDAVDAFFMRALPAEVECRLVDGRDPERVLAALAGEPGAGTRLVRAAPADSAASPWVVRTRRGAESFG